VATLPHDRWYTVALCEARDAFFRAGGAPAVAALRDALAHADMRMRRDAAAALGATGDPAVVPWLLALRDDPVGQVRTAAQEALATVGIDLVPGR
jgi:HEAT repeat protein